MFAAQVKKYLNRDLCTNVKLRGRAKHRRLKGGTQQYQPLKTADSFVIYLEVSPLTDVVSKAKEEVDKSSGVCYT